MTSRRSQGGAALVPGWTAARVLRTPTAQPVMRLRSLSATRPAINLVQGLVGNGAWPVRNQGHRSTCNAFSVVAAEELWTRLHKGAQYAFSEELLYKAMRSERLPPVVDPQMKDVIEETGTTFLWQAREVIGREGLHDAALAPYVLRPSLTPAHVTKITAQGPGKSKDARFVHDMAASPDISGKLWVDQSWMGSGTLSDFIYDRLTQRIPVVVALALLEQPGISSFLGPNGRLFGRVWYPPPAVAQGLSARSGHSVCIVGYRPGPAGGDISSGTFLFRNSYGTSRFGAHLGRRPSAGLPPGRGYGSISATDLERYCWEFLCRAD
jgi:hypothetical protein